jgi:NAD-dependent SIR2 family protein deacetylase
VNETTKSKLLDSMWAGRLVIFCGAGLSMGTPSGVPSAASLADQCANAYEQTSGATLPIEMHRNVEVLADYFAERRQLESIFLSDVMQRIPDFRSFFRNPNAGHEAIADFLACSAIELNISTNVDDLVEHAAELIGEPKANVAVTRAEVARSSLHKPHVKLHGCFRRDMTQTLWSTCQLNTAPFRDRIREFTEWLPGVLFERDLIFVGFWSDWSYLNQVLGGVIQQSRASRIVLVNPSGEKELKTKAQDLWDLAHQRSVELIHERQYGHEFLDELRKEFSFQFMRRLITAGTLTFTQVTQRAAPALHGFESLSSRDLYEWRQDSTGTPPGKIVRKKMPDETMHRLGALHLEMLAAGALIEGSAYTRSGRRVRLIHGAGRLVGQIRAEYASSTSLISDDPVVCVGAENSAPLPDSVARGNRADSVVRPGVSGTWMTEAEAHAGFSAEALQIELQGFRDRISTMEQHRRMLAVSDHTERIIDLERDLEAAKAAGLTAEKHLSKVRRIEDQIREATLSLKRIGAEAVEERLAAIKPLFTELYLRLRPHIDWKDVSYAVRGDVRKFLSLRVDENLNLKFLFSSGQRRATGLAFLISVALSRPWSRFRTLILDDPIQHVDDFRAVHLVETLAAIRTMKYQLICAVEDPALADLLGRRLRSSYREGGAVVRMKYVSGDGAKIDDIREIAPFELVML